MFDNLFDKAYEAEGEVSLAISLEVLMVILMVISIVYILYSLVSITAEGNTLFYCERYLFPVLNFYLLGCCIGQSGYGCIFGVVDGTNDGSDKIRYTISNIKDWHFAKYALIAGGVCILFIFIVQIILAKKPMRFLRDVLLMTCISVFGYCAARFAMTVDGFLLKLLFLPTSALAFVCQFMWLIALLFWFMSSGVAAAMNRHHEATERVMSNTAGSSDADDLEYSKASSTSFPSSVTDSQGNTWRLSSDSGDHAEYQCSKTGARRTFWRTDDYVDFPSGWRY